jgi:hypothetical protein
MRKNEDGSSAKGGGDESPSPEAVAFETALRQVLKVSKEEVERREEEARKTSRSVAKPRRARRSVGDEVKDVLP